MHMILDDSNRSKTILKFVEGASGLELCVSFPKRSLMGTSTLLAPTGGTRSAPTSLNGSPNDPTDASTATCFPTVGYVRHVILWDERDL